MAAVIELTNNLTLLLSLIFIYGLVRPRLMCLGPVQHAVLMGLIFGVFAVIAMLIPFELAPGYRYDGRNVILAIAALFGGPVPGIITGILIMLYRTALGGAGVPLAAGIASAIIAAGLLIRRWAANYCATRRTCPRV